MNNLDTQYQSLLKDILDNGTIKKDRTGIGTISIFGRQIRHKMSDGFPLLTTKKMAFKSIVTELLWFLKGRTDLRFLLENGCHIWVGDAYKKYEQEWMKENPPFGAPNTNKLLSKEEFVDKIKTNDDFSNKWGNLGPIYGKQWRHWENEIVNYAGTKYDSQVIDQIQQLINDLENNPDSRRLMVNAWNVGEINRMILPPCHYGFQVYTKELKPLRRTQLAQKMGIVLSNNGSKSSAEWDIECDEKNVPKRSISLMFNMRSVDVPLGLPFNIASYGLLLEILGKMVNMVPDELIGNLGDAHIYSNQVEGIEEQLIRTSFKLPSLDIHPGILDYDLDKLKVGMFTIKDYQSHSTIKMPLSN